MAWAQAKTAVSQINISRQFKTLRDMGGDAMIPFDDMTHVCMLGEGAFGAVEKRKYVGEDGKAMYFAVKRLKKQDVALQLKGKDNAALSRMLVKMSSLAVTQSSIARKSESADRQRHSAERQRQSAEGQRPSKGDFVDAAAVAVEAVEKVDPAATGADPDAEVRDLVSHLSKDDQMFLAEVGIMRKLSHPYIIRYYGCGVITDRQATSQPAPKYIAIAQECCEGGTLGNLVMRGASSGVGPRLYSYEDALRWSTQIAKALEYLHGSHPQVLHRDLKAENVLLTEAGRGGDIRVMDFGLTKLRKLATVGWEKVRVSENYIMTGQTGSFIYMAPEVVRSEPYNDKVDIFSLAIIMYELFCMCPLAARVHKSGAPDEFAIYAMSVANGHREQCKSSWPQQLKDMIVRCWAEVPDERPSARQLVAMLEDLKPTVAEMDAACRRKVVSATAKVSKPGGGCGNGCVVS